MHVITGALGFTGRFLTRRLLARGEQVRTLTGHPDRPNPFGDRLEIHPLDFTRPEQLQASLTGAEVLYNTYWVRFNHGGTTFDQAVENSRTLFQAAAEAGVQRLVHISIANPRADSPLAYYRGKAQVEQALAESGVPHSMLRPALLFGEGDVLLNNLCWICRHYPVMFVPGRGDYRVQPIHVDDLAGLMVREASAEGNRVSDAAGPDILTFDQLLALLRETVRSRTRFLHVPPWLALLGASLVGRLVGDVMLTREEWLGLSDELLVSREPPQGEARLADWLQRNAATVGLTYANEVARHFR